jgi:hypothetical protein
METCYSIIIFRIITKEFIHEILGSHPSSFHSYKKREFPNPSPAVETGEFRLNFYSPDERMDVCDKEF